MTTMNNTMNTIRKPAYITMRTTVLNGDSWDFLLDISPLAKEEIVPVLSCLVNGPLDEKYRTPKAWEFIQNVLHDATETLVNFCFDDRKLDHSYTVSLIRDTHKVGLCCKECRDKELATLHQLFAEYTAGIEYAAERIALNLYEFFADTTPFVFDVIPNRQ